MGSEKKLHKNMALEKKKVIKLYLIGHRARPRSEIIVMRVIQTSTDFAGDKNPAKFNQIPSINACQHKYFQYWHNSQENCKLEENSLISRKYLFFIEINCDHFFLSCPFILVEREFKMNLHLFTKSHLAKSVCSHLEKRKGNSFKTFFIFL